MKKKLGVIITLLTLCICLMTPQMHAKAASGKTTIAVSAGSLNIGQTVTVTANANISLHNPALRKCKGFKITGN